MKILYVGTADFPTGGAAGRCMHMIAKGLVQCGHDVTVLMGRRMRPGPYREKIDGIEIIWSSAPIPVIGQRSLKKLFYVAISRIKLAQAIFRLALERKFDWMISYSVGVEVMLPIALACHRNKTKLASQYGDIISADYKVGFFASLSLSEKFGQIIGLRTSDVILNSGSKALEEKLARLSPRAKIIRLLPPVDARTFISAEGSSFIDRYRLNNLRLITYVGGFKSVEGLGDLIKALEPTLKKNTVLRLVLAGGAAKEDLKSIQSTADQSPCRGQIIFPGQLDLADVASLLAASDVLVITKTDHPVNHHAMPIKLGEYFASGKPVVSAAIGGIVDYLEDGKNGLLYHPGDMAAFRKAVEELLGNDEMAKRLGHAGQKTALETFDIDVIASHLAASLNELPL